jgi:hypothetical protein
MNKIYRTIRGFGLAMALIGGPAHAATGPLPGEIFAKPGATGAQANEQEAQCRALTKKTQAFWFDAMMWPGRTTPVQTRGAGLLPFENWDARAKNLVVCMRNRGFAQLKLTAEEFKSLSATKADAREQWLTDYMAGPIEARVAAGIRPRLPPLPELRDEPNAVGPFLIDVASIKLVATALDKKGEVITGIAHHRRVALLKTRTVFGRLNDNKGPLMMGFAVERAEPGTIFMAQYPGPHVSTDIQLDPTAWCGPTVLWRGDKVSSRGYSCVANDVQGYRTMVGGGEDWLSAPSTYFTEGTIRDQPIELVEQSEDLLGPVEFRMTVQRVFGGFLSVTAYARKDGKELPFWRADVSFDKSGHAYVPFWGQRLVITRAASGLVAALEPTSDKLGWYDVVWPGIWPRPAGY